MEKVIPAENTDVAETAIIIIEGTKTKRRNTDFIYVSENHKTTKNILAHRAFTVSVANTENVTAKDSVGIVSGNNEPDNMKNPVN